MPQLSLIHISESTPGLKMETREPKAAKNHIPIRPSLFLCVPSYVLFSNEQACESDPKVHEEGGMEWQVKIKHLRVILIVCLDEKIWYCLAACS